MPKPIDITHQKFGRLTAIRMTVKGSRGGRGQRWLFRCDCGNEIEVDKHHVTRGATRSCGCLNMEMRIERSTTHGHSRRGKTSPEYKVWNAIRQRCSNPNNLAWEDYGGRGIAVCDPWNDFEIFLADMGPKPSPRHEIDGSITRATMNPAIAGGRFLSSEPTIGAITTSSQSMAGPRPSRNGHGMRASIPVNYVSALKPAGRLRSSAPCSAFTGSGLKTRPPRQHQSN
jgi:hypothetical protein